MTDEPTSASRARWVIVVSTTLCVIVMGVVVGLALQKKSEDGGAAVAGPAPPPYPFRDPRDPGSAAARLGPCGEPDPTRPPRIVFEVPPGGLDVGAVKQGVTLEREVTFRSAGKGPLCVVKVESGCGCLKASLIGKKARYEPGETGRILVKLDSTGREGVVRKRVTVLSNDMEAPHRSFNVRMDVSLGLVVAPQYVNFGSRPRDTASTATVLLRSPKDAPPWKVTEVAGTKVMPDGEFVSYVYDAREVEDPRFRKVEIKITHPGSTILGPFRESIVIGTTHPERPEIKMRAHLEVVRRIYSPNKVVSLGWVQSDAPRRPARIRLRRGSPDVVFDVVGVDVVPRPGRPTSPVGVGYTATFGKDKIGWWVEVSYDGKSRKPGLLEAELVIRTSDPEQPELRIPIRSTIRK